jgi:hypothetical protein
MPITLQQQINALEGRNDLAIFLDVSPVLCSSASDVTRSENVRSWLHSGIGLDRLRSTYPRCSEPGVTIETTQRQNELGRFPALQTSPTNSHQ